MRLHRVIPLAIILFLGIAPVAQAQEQTPEVIASIRPVHSLVQIVLGDTGEAGLLLHGSESPHDTGLKPSQFIAIENAKRIFYISAEFERFLARNVNDHGGAVALAESAGLKLLPPRDDYAHGHDEKYDHHDKRDRDHGDAAVDFHIWLDPENAAAMLDAIAAELAAIHPEFKAVFMQNTAAAKKELAALDAELAARLRPHRGEEIEAVVFHDSLQYFERRYGIKIHASVFDVHGRTGLSAARLAEIEDIVAKEDIDCVFGEPQYARDKRLIRRIAGKSDARLAEIDPLGQNIPKGAGHYAAMMRGIADAIIDCAD